jgi:protein phosphatase methylesterase 1
MINLLSNSQNKTIKNMSDLLRALPTLKPHEQIQPPARPSAKPLTTADDGSSGNHSSSSDSSTSTADSISTLRPTSSSSTHALPSTPNPWPHYFAQELYLQQNTQTQSATYHVYLTPPRDAIKGPLFICHHGAGATGMSFACFAAAVRKLMPEAGVCSLEAREHGSIITTPGFSGQAILDFDIETLVSDTLCMIELIRQKQAWQRLPPTVLIGHSLGGAIVTRIAASATLGAQLVGFAVLDVVEGSAIEALLHMKTYIASRPSSFASVEQAINWHIRSRTIRDMESARASVPSLLVKSRGDDGEEQQEARWVWRTDLSRTQKWWEGWFTGMSGLFLKGRAAKSLLLAGTDRLDKELMVGQMQGEFHELSSSSSCSFLSILHIFSAYSPSPFLTDRIPKHKKKGKFQLHVLPEAGHFIHEDAPEKTAHLMIEFFKRNDRSAMVLPPKVSDLLAQGKRV